MTRALDADTGAELNAAVVTVREGTANGGTTWRQTTVDPTLGTEQHRVAAVRLGCCRCERDNVR
ncbi:MAG: hypothetical protein KatS3mg038_2781 [Candidatus Kapaibacterium sp.]|nr:MAG: hypothetical protein KatS3mg038_2781 [Candidatus Kapabacteria bacterium]